MELIKKQDKSAESDQMFYHISDLCRIFSMSRTTLWKLTKTSSFPKPVKFYARKKMWLRDDIEKWGRSQSLN